MTTLLLFLAICAGFFAALGSTEVRQGLVGLWLGFVVFVFPIVVLMRIF